MEKKNLKTPQNVASLYMTYMIVIINIVLTGMCYINEQYGAALFVGICTALTYILAKMTRKKMGL